MPDLIIFAPIVLPLVGAGALLFLNERYTHRSHDPLPALIAGTVFAALLLLLERTPSPIEILPWSWVEVFGNRPAILIDQFALPFIFGLLLLAIASALVGDNLNGRNWAMALLLWGGTLMMVMAANPLMLLLSWILCESALIGASLLWRDWRLLAYRLAIGGVGGVALLLLLMQGKSQPATDLQSVLAGLSPRWMMIFFVVGAIRMGLYPFHLAGFGPTDAPLPPLVLGRLASAMAGLYLWFRGLTSINEVPSQIEYLIIWGGLVALISAFVTWEVHGDRSLLPWVVGFELGIIIVALGFGTPQLTMLAALEMFNLLLAGAVFGLSLYAIDYVEGRWDPGWIRGLTFLAAASLLGLPPTPGFVARWGLYREALEGGRVAAIMPIVVASGLLVPSLFAILRGTGSRPIRFRSGYLIIGLTVLGLPLVLASAQPLILSPVLDAVVNLASYPMMVRLIRGASSRITTQVIALLVIPALAGYSLDRVYESLRADNEVRSVWQFLSLDWLYDLLASTVLRAAIVVSILLTFLELGSVFGWVIIAGLLVVLLLLRR